MFIVPRFDDAGHLARPARITVFHNGVLTQLDVPLAGPTVNRGTPRYRPHPARLPLVLQDHRSPVSFRNIWIRELNFPTDAGAPPSAP